MTRLGIGIVVAALVAVPLALAQPAGVPATISDYWSWTRLNIDRSTDNPTGAHPQSKDIYINLDPAEIIGAGGQPNVPYPDGTIVVKERNDGRRLLVDRLYMMEKAGGEWVYRVFDRQADGSFRGQDYGTRNFCRDCHAAAPTDFVFVQFERR